MAILEDAVVDAALAGSSWHRQGEEIERVVELADFAAALAFVNEVGRLAESANHHPDIDIRWNTVTLRLSTHSEGGLTDRDLSLAAEIDAVEVSAGADRVPAPLGYRGLDELDGRRHVMVDGAARPGSVLVLSHWPATPTPRRLWRDLSAEIALAYIDEPGSLAGDADCVTLDHLDADGLASLFVLVDPQRARRIANELVDFARAGDFGVADERSARAVFAFEALRQSGRTRASSPRSPMTATTRQLLEQFESLVTDPDRFESAWSEEDARYRASVAALANGDVAIEERVESMLAVVTIDDPPQVPPSPVTARAKIPLHPFAVHSLTEMPRLLVLWEGHAVYYDRYETWVRYVSRPLPKRVDLGPLAARLQGREESAATWVADLPGAIVPVLSTDAFAATSLSPTVCTELVEAHLVAAPAAWDPFAAGSPLPG